MSGTGYIPPIKITLQPLPTRTVALSFSHSLLLFLSIASCPCHRPMYSLSLWAHALWDASVCCAERFSRGLLWPKVSCPFINLGWRFLALIQYKCVIWPAQTQLSHCITVWYCFGFPLTISLIKLWAQPQVLLYSIVILNLFWLICVSLNYALC